MTTLLRRIIHLVNSENLERLRSAWEIALVKFLAVRTSQYFISKQLCSCMFFFLFILIDSTVTMGQFTLSGELRPRTEYRHGFSTLAASDQRASFFTDQRTRLNMDYRSDKYKLKIVLQDIRTWGSQSQLTYNQDPLTSLHEAWAELFLDEQWSVKIGRQEISYDDHRIFGNVGWAQQARSHDAGIVKFSKNKLNAELGLAFNQDGPQINTSFYSVPRSYKTFQYLWVHKDLNGFAVSFLFLNNGKQGGIPTNYKTYFSQTIGTHIKYAWAQTDLNGSFYHQSGDEPDGRTNISAVQFSINAQQKLSDQHSLGIGYEFLSGNDQTETGPSNQAFNPFYGTNHKFNGVMDYFYVGNHIGSVGLRDLSINYTAKFSDQLNFNSTLHFFSSAATAANPFGSGKPELDNRLGTEIDFISTIKVNNEVSIKLGYSQMFGTRTLEALKGGSKDELNNWSWAMIVFKPTLFTINNNE